MGNPYPRQAEGHEATKGAGNNNIMLPDLPSLNPAEIAAAESVPLEKMSLSVSLAVTELKGQLRTLHILDATSVTWPGVIQVRQLCGPFAKARYCNATRL